MQNTSHAVMAQRAEGKESLDDFPTPPWATRALVERVLGGHNVRELTCLEPDWIDRMRLGKPLKKLEAHVWEREANEHYVEPDWCSRRLFEEEDFRPTIWDPCAGFGRIPEEAAKQGLKAHATDIVDRGYSAFDGVQNFLTAEATRAPVIVCNPPFATASHFAVKALSLEGVEQVAMIFPTARLNAAHWLRDTPLARVWLMTPRPSMPPGHVIATGEKPGGGKMDFCWLVWDRAYSGAPAMQWLHRAGRTPV